MSAPARPRLPSRFPLPGRGRLPDLTAGPDLKLGEAEHDEYGLARHWAGDYCPRVREYLAAAYEYLRLDKDAAPARQGLIIAGTVPELVFFGGLLKRGLLPFRDFEFQSEALGGREMPGGAVLDFVVFVRGLKVAVPVQSVFHASDGAFAGQSKVFEDYEQRVRVVARGSVDRVVPVNLPELGYPLERGPDELCDQEFYRVMTIG